MKLLSTSSVDDHEYLSWMILPKLCHSHQISLDDESFRWEGETRDSPEVADFWPCCPGGRRPSSPVPDWCCRSPAGRLLLPEPWPASYCDHTLQTPSPPPEPPSQNSSPACRGLSPSGTCTWVPVAARWAARRGSGALKVTRRALVFLDLLKSPAWVGRVVCGCKRWRKPRFWLCCSGGGHSFPAALARTLRGTCRGGPVYLL